MSEIIIADIDLDEKDLELMLAKQTIREKDAQIKVAIEAFKQQCKPMYAEGGLARCLQDIATEALKQIGAGE